MRVHIYKRAGDTREVLIRPDLGSGHPLILLPKVANGDVKEKVAAALAALDLTPSP